MAKHRKTLEYPVSKIDRELLNAVHELDYGKVQTALDNGADPNCLDEKGTHIKAGGINFTQYIQEKAKEEGITELEEIKEYVNKYNFEYDEVNIISSVWKVQRAYRVKGGTIIEFQNKKIY